MECVFCVNDYAVSLAHFIRPHELITLRMVPSGSGTSMGLMLTFLLASSSSAFLAMFRKTSSKDVKQICMSVTPNLP